MNARHNLSPAIAPLRLAQPKPITIDITARFGHRLREMRTRKGLTQTALSGLLGMDRSYLSDVERGRKSISLPMLEVLALGFKTTLSEMLDGL